MLMVKARKRECVLGRIATIGRGEIPVIRFPFEVKLPDDVLIRMRVGDIDVGGYELDKYFRDVIRAYPIAYVDFGREIIVIALIELGGTASVDAFTLHCSPTYP